ncbi:hypothetical protein ACHGLA_06900 [Streptomyces sp. YH02]|uniref:hypothetical protein n=1 Tax=Streptomyces sp. YH02 TaxID=3256999 RepID=UPI003757BF10
MSILPRRDSTHSAMCGNFAGRSALLSAKSWQQANVSMPHSRIAWIAGASCNRPRTR